MIEEEIERFIQGEEEDLPSNLIKSYFKSKKTPPKLILARDYSELSIEEVKANLIDESTFHRIKIEGGLAHILKRTPGRKPMLSLRFQFITHHFG